VESFHLLRSGECKGLKWRGNIWSKYGVGLVNLQEEMDIMEPQHAGHGEEFLLILELTEDGQDSDKWKKFLRRVASDGWCIAIDCLNCSMKIAYLHMPSSNCGNELG
jgi:hypothetical protein